MRGRMSSVFSLVVTSGPRLGDVEAGAVAGLTGAALLGRLRRPGLRGRASRAIVVAFPALVRYDAEEAIAAVAEREAEPVPA